MPHLPRILAEMDREAAALGITRTTTGVASAVSIKPGRISGSHY